MSRARRRRWWPLLLLLLLPLPWLLALPDGSRLEVVSGGAQQGAELFLDPALPQPGQPTTAIVEDEVPWAYVQLTVNGEPARWGGYERLAGGRWRWRWQFSAPEALHSVAFYRDCHGGCLARARWALGDGPPVPLATRPTKLGVVFPDPERDWHGRSGWAVELTYARRADQPYWGVDDLAARVETATAQGLRVLVRVDYEQGQSLPSEGDPTALAAYLDFMARLARDERLAGVYGYIVGSGYNALDSNRLTGAAASPEWYARLFNGYGEPPAQSDNVVGRVRPLNPQVRLLVGPVRPWRFDRGGALPLESDPAPWLSYMASVVAALDTGTQARSAAGLPGGGPDGFALHVPGNPLAPELAGRAPSEEPTLSLPREAWGGAQAGFGLWRDWLTIINAGHTTRHLPAYITSTNTLGPDGALPPAESYPPGWLSAALTVVNEEPQLAALCWFVDRDRSGDAQWRLFSLHERAGQLAPAADEFDALLRGE